MIKTFRKTKYQKIWSACIVAASMFFSGITSADSLKADAEKVVGDVAQGFASGFAAVSSFTKETLNSRPKLPGSIFSGVPAKYPETQVPHILLTKPVADGRLTSRFGYRLNPAGIPLPKKHKGIDYAAPEGTAVYAAGDGIIGKQYKSRSFGNYIKIDHANGFSSAYAHLHNFADGLSRGSRVKKGQLIGTVGSTGRSTGAHLHYELHYNGKAIDPLFN